MRHIDRELAPVLLKASRGFPAVVLTGPRRAGKTVLLRKLFPKASYTLLEDPDVIARLRADPQGFLDGLALPAILDEVQNVPELLSYIRSRIDAKPRRTGQWFITGSQEAPLMRGVTESMAGRAAILHLYPLSTTESAKVDLLHGRRAQRSGSAPTCRPTWSAMCAL
jgi:predicted AAA+ superfamily ATPase